jgi:uncharacterized protein YecE (DUF72 family)
MGKTQIQNEHNFDSSTKFNFLSLHPSLFIGTASDRYAGWLGQIYTLEKYKGRIIRRTKNLEKNSYVEEVLPIDSVKEYFEHFPALEIDFTFYRLLLDEHGRPTNNYELLRNCKQYLKPDDRIVLKVPQVIMAQKLRQGKHFIQNANYLNPDIFTRQFYRPAMVDDAVNLVREILAQDALVYLIINNRVGGNAPMIAEKVAERFLGGW